MIVNDKNNRIAVFGNKTLMTTLGVSGAGYPLLLLRPNIDEDVFDEEITLCFKGVKNIDFMIQRLYHLKHIISGKSVYASEVHR